jgi:hypothetical protein
MSIDEFLAWTEGHEGRWERERRLAAFLCSKLASLNPVPLRIG